MLRWQVRPWNWKTVLDPSVQKSSALHIEFAPSHVKQVDAPFALVVQFDPQTQVHTHFLSIRE